VVARQPWCASFPLESLAKEKLGKENEN